ncbi:MAG: nucleoside-diphosphate sugar epimerase/dehydratase [Balneolaceae bacterium]
MTISNNNFRSLFFVAGDLCLLMISSIISLAILSVVVPVTFPGFPLTDILLFTGFAFAGLLYFKTYNIHWRFVSLQDLVRIFQGILAGTAGYWVSSLIMYGYTNFFLAFSMMALAKSLLLVGGFRISKRVLFEVFKKPKHSKVAIIYGAGTSGEQIVRDVLRNNEWELKIEAIFDDDADLWGTTLHNIKIRGGRHQMFRYLENHAVKEVIIAVPSIKKKDLKEIIDGIKDLVPKQSIKVLPSFHKLDDQPVTVKNVRNIRLEDILGREPAEVDFSRIQQDITDRTVLVTGAGGSIGSELVRQLVKFNPDRLIALDIDETELFHIETEFGGDLEVIPYVADVTDESKLDHLFEEYEPHMVFHAAAYKHVPMMERYPEEAVRVNVGGTKLLAEMACRHRVEKFILISTDKAVNPTNVMGATKRIAEQICLSFNDRCSTQFIAVRFGNVLGSRGSVVPLFIEQINDGGPVTITDPNVTRYFMTIPEAVLLVIQSGSMGRGGEVFVLDMGEPVKILDMAKQLIRLHGLEPDVDIPIVFNGLRPGEKLYEELLNAEEGVLKTQHAQIFKANCCSWYSREELDYKISRLTEATLLQKTDAIRELLKSVVPTYKYNGELLRATSHE